MGNNLKNKLFWISLFMIGLVYYFFLGDMGYVLGRDSITFIENDLKNYWVYCGFLNICERLFGNSIYLEVVTIIQGVIAFVVSIIVTYYFTMRFHLQRWGTLVIYVATFLPYGYSLPENVATHHILTEGLSFSIFHIFILFVMMVFLDKRAYMMLPAIIMLFLLIGTRSQLLLLVPVYVGILGVLGLQWIYKILDIKAKRIFWLVLSIIVIVICMLIPFLMKTIVEKNIMSQFVDAMSGRVLCTIEESDIDFVKEEYQGLCQFVYKKIDEKQTREVYFREGLRRWEDILYSTNENTKGIRDWIDEYYSTIGIEETRSGKEINYLTVTIFERHMASYFEMTFFLCVQSFVASIFIHPDVIYTLCHFIALFLYLLAMLLTIYSIRVNGEKAARIPIYITGIFLVANVVITNLFFFGQQRYVVYTFGFFYIALFLLSKDIWEKIWRVRTETQKER